MENLIEILFLSAAVSIDAFVACFAYGMRRIKIPLVSALLLTGISVLFLSVSLLAGSLLSSFVPAGLTTQISFLILFLLGILKLFERPDDSKASNADANNDHLLSLAEAFYLGIALSLDSLAAGLGVGMLPVFGPAYFLTSIVLAFLTGLLSIGAGILLGKTVSSRLNGNFSRISGLILIALAFMKFF